MKKPLHEIFPNPPEGLAPNQLDLDNIPQHVAVIMDGNGRWAKQRALNRLRGHSAGIEAVRETIRCANDLGVQYLSIYSFSTENWNRPQDEVDGLMNLFAKTMLAEVDELHAEHVRVMTIGDISALPQDTREAFEQAWEMTKNNDGMTLLVAVNYGGRAEIVHAVNEWLAEQIKNSTGSSQLCDCSPDCLPASDLLQITQKDIASHLYTANIPDPELLIRTSGEMRISNFMLWQIAYSELVVSKVLWPDFDRYELLRCLLAYQQRSRRFGGVA